MVLSIYCMLLSKHACLQNSGGVSEINDIVNKFRVLSQERAYTCWDD